MIVGVSRPKPFSPAELLAHLRALTRRQGQVVFETMEFGDLKLNLESHDLSCQEKSINLSYKEFSILSILMSNRNQIVSKDTLIAKVWGIESSAVDNNVEAYVSFIRKKLKHLVSSVQIETVRKVGYRLVAELPASGYKFGRWLGVKRYMKVLRDAPDPGPAPIPFPELNRQEE